MKYFIDKKKLNIVCAFYIFIQYCILNYILHYLVLNDCNNKILCIVAECIDYISGIRIMIKIMKHFLLIYLIGITILKK